MFLSLAFAALLYCTQETDPMVDLVKTGKVATLSSDFKGTPFGSLTPYALDAEGRPFLFLSDLAAHTKNLNKNPKCSIMVSKIDDDDLFNSARITFVGKMVKIDDDKVREKLKEIFVKKHKAAEIFIDFGDFNFYRMESVTIHYIGGFGDINWVTPAEYRRAYRNWKQKLIPKQ